MDKVFFKRSYKKHFFSLVCKTRKKNEKKEYYSKIK